MIVLVASAPATAHRDERGRLIAPFEFVERRRDQAAPRRPDGVAKGDGSAVHVHLVHVDLMGLAQLMTTEAKALVHLERSMSAMVMPALASTLDVAAMGPSRW